jgi:hypothetical protein
MFFAGIVSRKAALLQKFICFELTYFPQKTAAITNLFLADLKAFDR